MQDNSSEALHAFLDELSDKLPTVPDELTQYYLKTSGFDCSDVRMVRLVSLAAQKFLGEVTHDALHFTKQQRLAPKAKLAEQGIDVRDKRLVLTMEHLAKALQEYGVNASRPMYYASAQ